MRNKISIYLIVLLVILSALFCSAEEKPTLRKDQIDLIKAMEKEGFLKMKPELNTAYIHPDFWAGITFDVKKDFAAGLAIYCANIKKTDLYWVEIYDMYSGKKLAKYSQSWGFKVY
jgi:uncharacterized radical SAM superfamily Fe-S cluster-containing enzyme